MPGTLKTRNLDVDKWQAVDGPEVNSRSGDIRQAAGEHELGGGTFQIPGELAHIVARASGPGAAGPRSIRWNAGLSCHDDSVDAHCGGGGGNVCEVGYDGHGM